MKNPSRHLPLALVLALVSSLVTATRPVALSRPTSFVPAPSCVDAAQQGGAEVGPAQQTDDIPLFVRYGILFRRIAGPQPGRQEAKAPGDTGGSHYADLLRRELQLDDGQARALEEIAAECQGQVAEVDARAKAMIDAFRAQPSGGQRPDLAALEQERRSIIVKAREKLRTAFGEEVFRRFDTYVASHGSGRTFTLPPAGRPAIPLQARATVLSADGQTEKRQFRVGEKIVIRITLLNNSSRPVGVRQADLYDWFELSRIGEGGREPVFIRPPEVAQETEAARAGRLKNVELLPGQEAVVGAFDLSTVQRSLRPGQYVVSPHPHVLLNRPPDQSEFIDLTSEGDPVTLEVAP